MKEQTVCNVFNFQANAAEVVWQRFKWKEWATNKQREIAWMTFNECLMTRLFLKSRDLCSTDQCPREGCGSLESVYHVFWGCAMACKVRKRLGHFTREVIGLQVMCMEAWVFGLAGGDNGLQRRVWTF